MDSMGIQTTDHLIVTDGNLLLNVSWISFTCGFFFLVCYGLLIMMVLISAFLMSDLLRNLCILKITTKRVLKKLLMFNG